MASVGRLTPRAPRSPLQSPSTNRGPRARPGVLRSTDWFGPSLGHGWGSTVRPNLRFRTGPCRVRRARSPTGRSRPCGPSSSPTSRRRSACSPPSPATGPAILLESVERSERWGRYSFVAGDPAAVVVGDEDGLRPEDVARELALGRRPGRRPAQALVASPDSLRGPGSRSCPRSRAGSMGYLSYEAAGLLDGTRARSAAPSPPIGLLVIDRAVVFDHWRQRLLLVAHVPRRRVRRRRRRPWRISAAARPRRPRRPSRSGGRTAPVDAGEPNMGDERFREIVAHDEGAHLRGRHLPGRPVAPGDVPRGPRGASRSIAGCASRTPRRTCSSSACSGMELAGSSPEPLVRVEGRTVTTRPIAGTRPRGGDRAPRPALEHELLADPKERAEHAMLVDLARNDLGRVCSPGRSGRPSSWRWNGSRR